MSKEFEELLDKATIKMGDYTDTYVFFRSSWQKLIAINPYIRLKEAIDIKNMYDSMHSSQIKTKSMEFRHGGGKKATKKKKRRK